MIKKYPHLQIDDMLKHLFYGPSNMVPRLIYETETGFDIRFPNSGTYGRGIYFTDNAYSARPLAYTLPHNQGYQLFLSLVLVGDSVPLAPNKHMTIPPLKCASQTERYDSVFNEREGQYIIYDSIKSYPGYLITFK